jgi:hypothetical protein
MKEDMIEHPGADANTLQAAFDKVLTKAPYRALAAKMNSQLADQGVILTARETEKLAEHLQSGTDQMFRFRRWWPLWENRELNITLSESDIQSFQDDLSEFLERKLPDLVQSLTDDACGTILKILHKNWPSQSRLERRERRGFEKRLSDIWGPAIERLRMCLTVARECGELCGQTLRSKSDLSSPRLIDVLARLHARACQITEEIVCLLSSGFADGAMARWRTLHEIAGVAFLLRQHGEQLATRYVEHQVIESFRAATDYRHCSDRLGYEPMEDCEYEEVRSARIELLKRYGENFDSQYGWAAEVLKKPRPTIRDIQDAAGVDHLRAHYRMASHNVHANSKGVFFRMGLIDKMDFFLAGPSNVGLVDPGHSTAISLMQVSSTLCLLEPTIDSIVGMKTVSCLVDEIGDLFYQAHLAQLGEVE